MLAAALAALCFGCQRGEVCGRIAGKVTLQGKPVSAGRVYFRNTEKGICMGARLQEDGSYEVLTNQGRGLPLGDYQVSVTPPPRTASLSEKGFVESAKLDVAIPPKYRDGKTSGLTLTVKEGENVLNIDMQP
jgi:hypothetical protein